MKQSFSSYFKDERRQCARAFCMQRALSTPGHNCCLADNQLPFTVTEDTKACGETPERSCQLATTRLIKQVISRAMFTPVRSKVSTPRGLMFDNDTESRDAWSVSMATPQSEEQQVNLAELVDAANSSTSGDESCSSLSNVEHSGSSKVEQCGDDMKGEVISQRFVMKEKQIEGCHRTPLTLVARKLFTKTECDNLSSSHSTSPDLISSSQHTTCNSQDTMKNNTPVSTSPTCSQDMFDPAAQCDDITPSHVLSSTPAVNSAGRHRTIATNAHDVVGDHVENESSDTLNHKIDSKIHSHTGDVKLSGSDSSPDCKPDTTKQKCNSLYSNISCNKDVSYHDNSDLMDELFANNLSNLTQVATEQLLAQEQQLTHFKPITDCTDSACGDDVIDNDKMDHVITKDETVTPTTTANGFCHFTTVNPLSSTSNGSMRKSCKSFKAPRMAKEVGEDEKKKLMEQYCKKFPSLVGNDNTRRTDDGVTNNSTGRLISCGFTSAGSGKKLTVSAAALQHAVRLVEDCTGDLISEQYGTGSHGNCTSNEIVDHVEEQAKVASVSTDSTREVPFGTSKKIEEAKEPCLIEKEAGESSECDMEERSHDKGSHESVENYGLENIDMEQFSAFTQMPGYITVRSDDDIVEDDVLPISDEPAVQSCITPAEKQPAVSSYITPGGSFNPTSRTVYNTTPQPSDAQDDDDEELKKMFNTQLVKQFLDFSSNNEDDDSVKVTDQLQNDSSTSPTHNDEVLPCARSCDPESHTHNDETSSDSHAHNETCGVTENTHNDDHTHNGSHDDSPTHHNISNPSVHKGAVLGLSTASGKSVRISSDAISSVKKLLNDKTVAGHQRHSQLCTASGDVVNICDRSLRAVKQLFADDKVSDDAAAVAIGNHASGNHNKSTTVDMATAVQDDDIGVMSSNEPSAVVSSVQRSCDPTPDSTVAMEASPVKYPERITSSVKRRRRDPLYTTPEAVLSDRAHPKRMCFTPMVTNSNSIVKTPLSSGKQTSKFTTPFKAHRMSSTPQEKSVTTPAQPVWRRGWKKLGMSSACVSFHYSNNTNSRGNSNNKSVNDSGIGSSLPDQVTNTVEEQEGIDKQFEVTDTQLESFFATQGSVSPIVNHHDNSGVVRPQRGTLSMMRSTSVQRVSLTSLTGCVRPGRYSRHQLISLGVHPAVVDVTVATAVNFQFDIRHYFSQSVLQKGTVTVGDGVVLILEPHSDHVTMTQLQRAFFCSPGVDSKLINMEWFSNHYRWIVWKLASLEVSFPHSFAGKWLTPHWLLLHMKYRYDREIDLAHRSCIKKILERDDNSTKSMVLVITEICSYDDDVIDGSCDQADVKDTSHATVKMSDGWYSVGVVMDTPLKHILSTNQITVGCKLYISGARLLGSCDPCPPLECPDSVMLKINANSTRRAHWNARLGFQPCPVPFPVPMSSLYPDGGLVGCVHVTIVRTYPLQHMERTSDGNCVFRSQRKEEMVAKEYDTRRQQSLEDISLQVREEFEKELNKNSGRQCYRRRRSMSSAKISKLADGQKIDEALNSVPDPVEFEQHLSVTQKALLDSYRHGVLEQQRRELEQRMEVAIKECEDKLPPLRNVVPLLKVRVVGHPSRLTETDNIQSCILTVWRPTNDVMSLLQEGVSVKLYHVMGSSPHHHSPDYIQLATNRGTRFEQLSRVDEDLLQSLYQPRKVTSLSQLAASNHSVDYGQVDIIGIIITVLSSHITTANGREKSVDKVYITDDYDNIIVVKVWDGVESLISRDYVSAGQVVCFINLSYKAWFDDDGIPTCSTSDQSIVTIKPLDDYLKPAFLSLQKFIKSNSSVLKNLEERIAHLH